MLCRLEVHSRLLPFQAHRYTQLGALALILLQQATLERAQVGSHSLQVAVLSQEVQQSRAYIQQGTKGITVIGAKAWRRLNIKVGLKAMHKGTYTVAYMAQVILHTFDRTLHWYSSCARPYLTLSHHTCV